MKNVVLKLSKFSKFWLSLSNRSSAGAPLLLGIISTHLSCGFIHNSSGATYENATLKLVAGDVNRVPTKGLRRPALATSGMEESVGRGFVEESFFVIYSIP